MSFCVFIFCVCLFCAASCVINDDDDDMFLQLGFSKPRFVVRTVSVKTTLCRAVYGGDTRFKKLVQETFCIRNLHRIERSAIWCVFQKLSNTADQSHRMILLTCIGASFCGKSFLYRFLQRVSPALRAGWSTYRMLRERFQTLILLVLLAFGLLTDAESSIPPSTDKVVDDAALTNNGKSIVCSKNND